MSTSIADDVTVVVPTKNRARLLGRTLASILAQRGVDLEVVVVDDGSDDGTADRVTALGDPRIRVVRNDVSRGVSNARNAGTEAARTTWVAWCDDDDRWAPDKLRRQLDALSAEPRARWAACSAVVVDENDVVLGVQRARAEGEVLEAILVRNFVPGGGSGVLAERTLVAAAGGFDPELSLLADWDMWIRLAELAPAVHVDEPLVAYLRHQQAMSRALHRIDDELGHIRSVHADLRERCGVEIDDFQMLQWATRQHVRGRRRREAIHGYLRLARRTRNPVFVAKAAFVLAAPDLARTRDLRPIVPDPSWVARAEQWWAGGQDLLSDTDPVAP